MKKLLIGATVIAGLSLTACATGDNYASLVKEAEAKQAQSEKNGNVWKQRNMKQPYVEHYLAEAEKARKESVRLANEAVKSANAQLQQTKDGSTLKPGWYK